MSFKFNPFTGSFDIVNPKNFSFNTVLTGNILLIPQYQQMVIVGVFDLQGDIDIQGDLAVI